MDLSVFVMKYLSLVQTLAEQNRMRIRHPEYAEPSEMMVSSNR
jgi:hypothetical protein